MGSARFWDLLSVARLLIVMLPGAGYVYLKYLGNYHLVMVLIRMLN